MSDDEKQRIEDSIVDADDPVAKDGVTEATTGDSSTTASEESTQNADQTSEEQKISLFARLKQSISGHKKRTAAIAVVLLLALSGGAVYATDARFAVMNALGKASAEVIIFDEKTQQPIPDASITIAGQTAQTDKRGVAKLSNLSYGRAEASVKKFAYADKSEQTLIERENGTYRFALKPTGTPVSIKVKNGISATPVKGAKISFGESDAVSNEKGEVSLSIPPQDAPKATITIQADGFNGAKAEVELAQTKINDVTLTPAGKVFFLSKRTGKINVMKSNLDGTNPEVVVEGTGNENDHQTVLLASRDWKYLMLRAARNGSTPSIYLIDSATGKLTNVDEGKNAQFEPVGWHEHTFIFKVIRQDRKAWENGQAALKAFNADTQKLATLDETVGEGSEYAHTSQYFSDVIILKDNLVYAKVANNYFHKPKDNEIMSVRSDGSGKKVVQSFGEEAMYGVQVQSNKPQSAYFVVHSQKGRLFYEYENGSLQKKDITDAAFDAAFYPAYSVSPSGNKTFWNEPRDGKSTLMVGDRDGKSAKEVANKTEFASLGWFGEDYLLATKENSELFILPSSGVSEARPALKITDYHSAAQQLGGYGYGH
ncbi:hypothetical protein CYG49_03515 [Candidatus Saccharibacteria bacterium]|nr:MAG: hypothetical protein CYG49_03515 [Candidatus Saccharibacteria bacterium]